jgi:formylglycine-generating enzyme required for sulfatase activity
MTPPELLRVALAKANSGLAESIRETPALDGMGCTMVTAVLTKGKVYWVSVGDSHLYLIRDRELIKKNEDHSYGGYLDRMKKEGMDVEAEAGLSRNMLMSAMTGDEIAEVDCPDEGLQLLPGDRLLVCSDGLDTLSPGVIIQTSAWSPTAKECVAALLKAVEDAKKPRQDNTTVVVADVLQRTADTRTAPREAAPPLALEGQARTEDASRETFEPVPGPRARERDVAPSVPRARPGTRPRWGIVLVGLVVGGALAAGGWWQFLRSPTEPDPAPEPTTPIAGLPLPPGEPVEVVEDPPWPQPAPEAEPEILDLEEFRDALRAGGEGPALVSLPGGRFQMGSGGLSVQANERPRREVSVAPFAIGKYEVTMAEYERFARATGRRVPDRQGLDPQRHPVVQVTWPDAHAYTVWLSEQTGERYRLPSEAEWEYAASAGTTSPYWWGFEVGEDRAHCFDCATAGSLRRPVEVGRFAPNPLRLHDTAGNVHEWVADCYHPNYEGAPAEAVVWEGGDCSFRIARGGGFDSPSSGIRSQARGRFRPDQPYDSVGFRVVRDL